MNAAARHATHKRDRRQQTGLLSRQRIERMKQKSRLLKFRMF